MNKYQEAKTFIDSLDYGLTLPEINWAAIDEIQELIDNYDKYRWHDLRKDPNDMPKIDCAQYLIDTGDSHHYYRVATIIDGTFSIYDSEWNCFNEINAKRWKYIEEFEGE